MNFQEFWQSIFKQRMKMIRSVFLKFWLMTQQLQVWNIWQFAPLKAAEGNLVFLKMKVSYVLAVVLQILPNFTLLSVIVYHWLRKKSQSVFRWILGIFTFQKVIFVKIISSFPLIFRTKYKSKCELYDDLQKNGWLSIQLSSKERVFNTKITKSIRYVNFFTPIKYKRNMT